MTGRAPSLVHAARRHPHARMHARARARGLRTQHRIAAGLLRNQLMCVGWGGGAAGVHNPYVNVFVLQLVRLDACSTRGHLHASCSCESVVAWGEGAGAGAGESGERRPPGGDGVPWKPKTQ